MKQLILVVICIAMVYAESTNELDTVLQLITDLKNNVQLEIDALDAAWEMHKNNQQSVVDALAASEGEQRSECYKKDQEVESKKRDIQITTNYIDWMFKRQSLNSQRISILEANRCQQNNNYIHDIKNYKIAISLVQFLRSQIDKLSDTTSLIQKQEFLQSVSKFLKIYHTGKLINMIETLQQEDGSFIIPEIQDDEEDITEMALTQTRGKQQKSFLQVSQNDDDGKADNAVVLIPGGCDDSIQTVVVVQNDDGTNDNDDDMRITFTNGGQGGQGKPKLHVDPKPHQPTTQVDEVESQSEGEESTGEESTGEESTGEESTGEESTEEETVSEDGDGDIILGEESEGEEEEHKDNKVVSEVGGEEEEEEEEDQTTTDSTDHTPEIDEGITDTIDKPEEPTPKPADEDFPNTLEGLKKLLDAIEKHSRKSLDIGSGDEIRSAMTYIDFKIHIELENGTFDKHISNEKENLVKLNNQLTTRQQVANQCNARLKQISIAYKVYLEDMDQSYKNYLELRKQKQEELATFEDVHRIYVNQVAQ